MFALCVPTLAETVLLMITTTHKILQDLLGDQQKRPSKYGTVRACLAFFLGGISSAIRFTSLAAFVPMGLILASRRQGGVGSMMGFLFGSCALFGLLGIVATLVVDKSFYGFWVAPFLGNFHFNVVLGRVQYSTVK
jgi:phosphatidylinositol glycan class B